MIKAVPALLGAAVPFVCAADDARLVQSLKNKVVAVVLEIFGDLSPQGGKLYLYVLNVLVLRLYPVGVMMGVDDNVHIIFKSVADDLLQTLQPFAVNGIVGSPSHAVFPCCGYPESVKTRAVNFVYHFLGGDGISPAGLSALL